MIIEVSKKKLRIAGMGLMIVMAGILYWYIYNPNTLQDLSGESRSEAGSESKEEAESQFETESEWKPDDNRKEETPVMLAVHVSGAVVNADQVYYVEEGKRVADVIQAAGGALEDADLSKLNLAQKVTDGIQIYVPAQGEDIANSIAGNLNDITENKEKPLTNINLATTIELMELPGIGESYAERIIAYREEIGRFQDIEEIKNVSGIGDSTFEKIKDRITVSD